MNDASGMAIRGRDGQDASTTYSEVEVELPRYYSTQRNDSVDSSTLEVSYVTRQSPTGYHNVYPFASRNIMTVFR